MEQIARDFHVLATEQNVTRIKVKFDKPVSDGYRAVVHNGDVEAYRYNVDDGVIRRQQFPNRTDTFDSRGRVEKIVGRDGDERVTARRDGDTWDVRIHNVSGLRVPELTPAHTPGSVNDLVATVHHFLTADFFDGYSNDRIVFRVIDSEVEVTVGKGKKAEPVHYSMEG